MRLGWGKYFVKINTLEETNCTPIFESELVDNVQYHTFGLAGQNGSESGSRT